MHYNYKYLRILKRHQFRAYKSPLINIYRRRIEFKSFDCKICLF